MIIHFSLYVNEERSGVIVEQTDWRVKDVQEIYYKNQGKSRTGKETQTKRRRKDGITGEVPADRV